MTNRYRAGQPAPQQFPDSAYEHESTEQPGDLAWLLIAAMLTTAAMCIGFIAGRYFS